MNAAVVAAAGESPIFRTFPDPEAHNRLEVITVRAAALSNLTKGRASGAHYSSESVYPFVPGVDGVGTLSDGRRVYFVLPEAPFGAMAERALVDPLRTVPVPDQLDSVTAAAIANPGMSCWAALVYRAQMQPGETILVNGATGASGSVAVQLARQLGAKRVIATGRNAAQLEALRASGADVVLAFDLRPDNPKGVDQFAAALAQEFAQGLDVVVDYLWGTSARTIITTIARAIEDAHPVRFIQVGEASREPVELPAAALRSSAIQLMGSGLKSVPLPKLLESIRHTFELAAQGKLHVDVTAVPLAQVAETWNSPVKPRLVYIMQ